MTDDTPSRAVPTPTAPELDVRLLLANERTLLAWTRTAIALQAGGLAVAQFAPSEVLGRVVGAAAMVLGVAAAVIGWRRYEVSDRAIRSLRLPPAGVGPTIMIIATAVLAIVLFVVVVIGAW